jgi:hypothetical protein
MLRPLALQGAREFSLHARVRRITQLASEIVTTDRNAA